MALKTSSDCTGSFSSFFFSARAEVARLCVTRQRIEKQIEGTGGKAPCWKGRGCRVNTNGTIIKKTHKKHYKYRWKPYRSSAATPPSTHAWCCPLPLSDGLQVRAWCKAYVKGYSSNRLLQQLSDCGRRGRVFTFLPRHFLVKDSMIRQKLAKFYGQVKEDRRLFCLPGAGVDDWLVSPGVRGGH